MMEIPGLWSEHCQDLRHLLPLQEALSGPARSFLFSLPKRLLDSHSIHYVPLASLYFLLRSRHLHLLQSLSSTYRWRGNAPHVEEHRCGKTFALRRDANQHAKRHDQVKWPCPMAEERGCTMEFCDKQSSLHRQHGGKRRIRSIRRRSEPFLHKMGPLMQRGSLEDSEKSVYFQRTHFPVLGVVVLRRVLFERVAVGRRFPRRCPRG